MSESKYNVENVNYPYYDESKNYPKIIFIFFVADRDPPPFEEVWKLENAKRNHKR